MHIERHQLKKVHDILQEGVGGGGQLTTTTLKYYNFRRNKFHLKNMYKWRGTGGRGVKRTNDVMSVNVFPKGLGIYFLSIHIATLQNSRCTYVYRSYCASNLNPIRKCLNYFLLMKKKTLF